MLSVDDVQHSEFCQILASTSQVSSQLTGASSRSAASSAHPGRRTPRATSSNLGQNSYSSCCCLVVGVVVVVVVVEARRTRPDTSRCKQLLRSPKPLGLYAALLRSLATLGSDRPYPVSRASARRWGHLAVLIISRPRQPGASAHSAPDWTQLVVVEPRRKRSRSPRAPCAYALDFQNCFPAFMQCSAPGLNGHCGSEGSNVSWTHPSLRPPGARLSAVGH